MQQWKIALSIAVVGAIAAPFACLTYQTRPMSSPWVPLTAEEKVEISARLKETNNCQMLSDQVHQLADRLEQTYPHLKRDQSALTGKLLQSDEFSAAVRCDLDRDHLRDGGHFENERFDPLKYLAINAAVAGVAFGVVYGLTFLLPTIVRRYWKWLNA